MLDYHASKCDKTLTNLDLEPPTIGILSLVSVGGGGGKHMATNDKLNEMKNMQIRRTCQTYLHALSQTSVSDLEIRPCCTRTVTASLVTTRVKVKIINSSTQHLHRMHCDDVIMNRSCYIYRKYNHDMLSLKTARVLHICTNRMEYSQRFVVQGHNHGYKIGETRDGCGYKVYCIPSTNYICTGTPLSMVFASMRGRVLR